MLDPICHPYATPAPTARASSIGRAHRGWPNGERQIANRYFQDAVAGASASSVVEIATGTMGRS